VRHEDAGSTLISIASGSISNGLGLGPKPEVDGAGWLDQAAATFVTLLRAGALRGCVAAWKQPGRSAPTLPTTRWAPRSRSAFSGAHARRMAPVQPRGVAAFGAKPIQFADEDHLLALIRAGEDGLILEAAGRRATFLPQVWEEHRRYAAVPRGTHAQGRCPGRHAPGALQAVALTA